MRNLILNNKIFATPLLLYLVNGLGPEAFEYEPETIGDFLKSRNPDVSRAVIMRANAGLGLLTSNLFWYDLPTFCVICKTLNRNAAPTRSEPTLADISWGMAEAALIVSGDADIDDAINSESYKFSPAINKYVAQLLAEAGIYDNPATIPDIFIPPMNVTIDDPEQLRSIQERSDTARNLIDYKTNKNMAELLLQVSTAGIPLSRQAAGELSKLLEETKDYR